MSITNTTKPSTTVANAFKVSIGETWASIMTTWASETKTWQSASQLISNTTKLTSSISNTSKPA